MPFVADDLAAWLIGLLADAGRNRLTMLVLGSDQERALRSAATAAVRRTAKELCPLDDAEAEQLASVISCVFAAPLLTAHLAVHGTVLEGLQAGIARQLAVLDEPGLTGNGQSSADVLGVPGAVVAAKLTGHLVREIVIRGAGGGPLSPLASQLNHDLSYLQNREIEASNQRIEAALAQMNDSRRTSTKWSAAAAALSVIAAAASGLVTALVTTHPSWGLWVALVVLVIVGALLQAALAISDRLRVNSVVKKIKGAMGSDAVRPH